MSILDVSAAILAITAILAWASRRFTSLPPTIGVMGASLALSGLLLGLDAVGISVPRDYEKALTNAIDFSQVVMQGMLSILLFASALHVDVRALKTYRWPVGLLALFGTTASMLLIGYGLYRLLPATGIHLPLGYCLAFGALLAPTDPISVLGILRSAGAPASLEVVISGESLFNDGVAIALFSLSLSMTGTGSAPGIGQALLVMLREAGGGIALGLVLGFVAFRMLASLDSYQDEVLITLAAVVAGYALALRLGVSGPLAMVVAGLIVGSKGREQAMSTTTREHVDMFWELLDAILNAVLFMLLGLGVVAIPLPAGLVPAGVLVIALVLGSRLLTVGLPVAMTRRLAGLPHGAWQVLTWGGLRGGVSVALALSLPGGGERNLVIALTYMVAVFSILVQGLTIGPLVRRLAK